MRPQWWSTKRGGSRDLSRSGFSPTPEAPEIQPVEEDFGAATGVVPTLTESFAQSQPPADEAAQLAADADEIDVEFGADELGETGSGFDVRQPAAGARMAAQSRANQRRAFIRAD